LRGKLAFHANSHASRMPRCTGREATRFQSGSGGPSIYWGQVSTS
jgi:hypothetical protein